MGDEVKEEEDTRIKKEGGKIKLCVWVCARDRG